MYSKNSGHFLIFLSFHPYPLPLSHVLHTSTWLLNLENSRSSLSILFLFLNRFQLIHCYLNIYMQNFGDIYVICVKLQIHIAYYPYAAIGVQLAELHENKPQRGKKENKLVYSSFTTIKPKFRFSIHYKSQSL